MCTYANDDACVVVDISHELMRSRAAGEITSDLSAKAAEVPDRSEAMADITSSGHHKQRADRLKGVPPRLVERRAADFDHLLRELHLRRKIDLK